MDDRKRFFAVKVFRVSQGEDRKIKVSSSLVDTIPQLTQTPEVLQGAHDMETAKPSQCDPNLWRKRRHRRALRGGPVDAGGRVIAVPPEISRSQPRVDCEDITPNPRR